MQRSFGCSFPERHSPALWNHITDNLQTSCGVDFQHRNQYYTFLVKNGIFETDYRYQKCTFIEILSFLSTHIHRFPILIFINQTRSYRNLFDVSLLQYTHFGHFQSNLSFAVRVFTRLSLLIFHNFWSKFKLVLLFFRFKTFLDHKETQIKIQKIKMQPTPYFHVILHIE